MRTTIRTAVRAVVLWALWKVHGLVYRAGKCFEGWSYALACGPIAGLIGLPAVVPEDLEAAADPDPYADLPITNDPEPAPPLSPFILPVAPPGPPQISLPFSPTAAPAPLDPETPPVPAPPLVLH